MKNEAIQAINNCLYFMGNQQVRAMREGLRGEESQFFIDKFMELGDSIESMPETYGQDGKGDQAVAYLHYFNSSMDWYITEKDCDPDNEGQIQAFGLADLGYGAELGYISIKELIENNVELDLYFEPQTLAVIRKAA